MRRPIGKYERSLHVVDARDPNKPLLTELEDALGLLGKLRHYERNRATSSGQALSEINFKYDTHFQRVDAAIEFMEAQVAIAKQRVRDRAARYREEAPA